MQSKRFSKDVTEKIVSYVDDGLVDIIDTTAVSYALAAGLDLHNISAVNERRMKYAAISLLLPDLLVRADVCSDGVTGEMMQDLIGRVYVHYMALKFVKMGLAEWTDDGRLKMSDNSRMLMEEVLRAERCLADV